MTRHEAQLWCDELTNGWNTVDYDKILELFSETKSYYEDPFSTPGTTTEEIRGFWEEIRYQKITELSMHPIAIDGNTVIIRWKIDYIDIRTNERFIMDGIYQVEFNMARKCVNFVQWWVIKE